MVFEFRGSIRGVEWLARRIRKSLYDDMAVSVIVGTLKSVRRVWSEIREF